MGALLYGRFLFSPPRCPSCLPSFRYPGILRRVRRMRRAARFSRATRFRVVFFDLSILRPGLISVLHVNQLVMLNGRDYPEVTIIFICTKCTDKDKR